MTIDIQKELRKVASKDKAKVLARFFKTGKGDYGEGDKFLGVVVPEQRRIAKNVLAQGLSFARPLKESPLASVLLDLQKLLQSEWHEERLTALLILVELYKKSDTKIKKIIFNFYIKNLTRTCPVGAKRSFGVNNWDLVDLSAPNIVGDYLLNFYHDKKELNIFLLKLARSKNLWSRRVAVLATFPFIKNKKFKEILELTKFLIFKQKENHDLMHKALGWMLREVGKKDMSVLQKFLSETGSKLPRVTLRYAIERMSKKERKKFLAL